MRPDWIGPELPPPAGVFVTGTDTGVGKTRVTVGLIAALRASGVQAGGMKPVAAGHISVNESLINEDTAYIAEIMDYTGEIGLLSPCSFSEPASPHIAANVDGKEIDIALIAANFEKLSQMYRFLVVEGAGGWHAPIAARQTMADVARALDLPVLLVVGLRLGCLNHAALTYAAIRAAGLPFAGWMASCIDPDMRWREENLEQLSRMLDEEPLAVLPHAADRQGDGARLGAAAARLLAGAQARVR